MRWSGLLPSSRENGSHCPSIMSYSIHEPERLEQSDQRIPPISTLSEERVRNPQKNKKEVQFSDHESARCPRRASGCAETQSSLSRSVSDLHLNSNESGVKLHIGAFVSGLKITRMFVTEPSPRIVSCWACFVGVGPRRRRSVQDLPVLKAKVWSDALR